MSHFNIRHCEAIKQRRDRTMRDRRSAIDALRSAQNKKVTTYLQTVASILIKLIIHEISLSIIRFRFLFTRRLTIILSAGGWGWDHIFKRSRSSKFNHTNIEHIHIIFLFSSTSYINVYSII